MLIKIIGIVLVFLCFTMFGFYQSYKLNRRKRSVADILLFLNKLSTAIRYRTSDIYTLVDDCSHGCLLPLKNKKEYLKAVDELNLYKDERKLLKAFFTEFGKTDVDGELSNIEYYKHIFAEQYQTAKSEIEKKSKLYRMSGLFTGLAFAVILS